MIDILSWLWRRIWLLPIVLILLLLAGAVVYTEAGRFVSSPVDTPEPADLIAALGGESANRPAKAAELYAAGLAPRVFLTGPKDQRHDLLLREGVPAPAILLDGKSAHSWDEAINTYDLMRQNGWKRVLVVSDPEHIRRLSWTWEHVFGGSGLSFRLIAAAMPNWDAAHWWRDPGSAAYVKLELEKLLYYFVRHGSEGPEYRLPERKTHGHEQKP